MNEPINKIKGRRNKVKKDEFHERAHLLDEQSECEDVYACFRHSNIVEVTKLFPT